MIHTMTIMAPIYPDADAILPILHIMNLPEDLFASEFSPDFNPNDISPKSRRFYKTNSPGINMIKLTRIAVKEDFKNAAAYTRRTGFPVPQDTKFKKNKKTYLPAKYAFFLSIELNPYRLIHPEDNHSINLFIPTSDNVNALENSFTDTIDNLFPSIYPHRDIKDLRCYNLRRIDFSFNLRFETEDEQALFQKLVHKTSSHVRTEPLRLSKKIKERCNYSSKYDESASEKNKSYKIICYNKSEDIRNQAYISSDEKRTLLFQSYGIQRFEVQIKNDGIEALMNRHHFDKLYRNDKRRVLHFLSPHIAYQELINFYTKVIGQEDFHDRYHAKKILKDNYQHCRTNKASKLIDVIEIVAQTRSMDMAKKRFTEGGYFVKISNKIVEGSAATFRTRIKDIRAAQVNPVTITDSDNATYLRNPVYQIHDAYRDIASI